MLKLNMTVLKPVYGVISEDDLKGLYDPRSNNELQDVIYNSLKAEFIKEHSLLDICDYLNLNEFKELDLFDIMEDRKLSFYDEMKEIHLYLNIYQIHKQKKVTMMGKCILEEFLNRNDNENSMIRNMRITFYFYKDIN